MKPPVITAYKSIEDLKQLKKWFYDYKDETDNRLKAVQIVKGLATRGNLPHGVEATSFLTTMVLNDNQEGQIDSNTLQLAYTMALIRFVNGLLDPFQQSNYAIPMHLLAKQLNLPTYFVELRHMGTHESLPSLDILRITCANALNWLYENFWSNMQDSLEELSEASKDPLRPVLNFRVGEIETLMEKHQIYNNLKTYKRIRKQDLDKVYDLESSGDESAIKYNTCLSDIQAFAEEDMKLFVNIMLFKNYLIYPSEKVKDKKSKFNPLLIKLYGPLLDRLGVECRLECFQKIINIISHKPIDLIDQKLFKKLGFITPSEPDEIVQLLEWLSYFTQDLSKSKIIPRGFKDRDSLVSTIIDGLESIETKIPQALSPTYSNVLESLLDTIAREKVLKSHIERLTKWSKLIQNLQATKKTYELPPSLDDLLGISTSSSVLPSESPQSSKRSLEGESNEGQTKKQNRSDRNELFLLTPHENWMPTPFGACV